jgi:hypothetical protein
MLLEQLLSKKYDIIGNQPGDSGNWVEPKSTLKLGPIPKDKYNTSSALQVPVKSCLLHKKMCGKESSRPDNLVFGMTPTDPTVYIALSPSFRYQEAIDSTVH